MKVNSIIKASLVSAVMFVGFSACEKVEGPGGQASITGNVSGTILSNSGNTDAEAEVTTITFTPGALIDDNDYWLINHPNGNQYYIWYDNSNWVGGDPFLTGRIGIKVDYDFSESNATIAANTLSAMQSIANNDFSVAINNDILTVTCLTVGQTPDAEDMNSPFAIDVQTQGSSFSQGTSSNVYGPIIDERVYIIYGDDDYYSDIVRTDSQGNYHFNYLEVGDYRMYSFSTDSLNPNGLLKQIEVSVEIGDKKDNVTAPQIIIVK